jgi:hypothetical protein
LKKTGDPKKASQVGRPSDETIDRHKKRHAASATGRSNTDSDVSSQRKKNKKKDGQNKKNNGPQFQGYLPPSPSPPPVATPPILTTGGALSIGALGDGAQSLLSTKISPSFVLSYSRIRWV